MRVCAWHPKISFEQNTFPPVSLCDTFPINVVLFAGGQDKLKSLLKSEWQRQDRWWLEGVWGCGLRCIIMHSTAGSVARSAAGPWVLCELSPQYRSVCPQNSHSVSPGAKLRTLGGNFTLTRCVPSHFGSPDVSDRDRDAARTHKHTHTQIPVQIGDATVLSSRLSLSCVPGLCSCCPLCDWCLASLALTNTDWSHTLNDFGPNSFKDGSLVCSCQISASQLYKSSGSGVKAKKQRCDTCASYLPTSSTTGAGQSRKVSSIPAGLSSAQRWPQI